ncbi:hypothetical protein [Ruminococcus albus]|uniref:hypothetical protein n=1 Tax=Ruminococcus albus TaxID=1264 RepID=UPI0004642E39|nr:hypothetical protein [Ruminococcus albus]
MHKRTQEERIFGTWVVVDENSNLKWFFHNKDAKEYKQFCENNGINAYICKNITDSENENFGYYFE